MELSSQTLQWCKKNQIHILQPHQFPPLLQQIHSPPAVLFVKGNLKLLNQPLLAVVGARKASAYGLASAFRMSRKLALDGIGIVSGLARGVDSASHRGALHGKGATVAVMGAGFETLYPPENRELAYQILARGGAWVTEYLPGIPPLPQNFPQRNRIISALSLGTLVVEARRQSGSLITALTSLDQGREVFVLPGPAHHVGFEGGHQLIQQGAKCIVSAGDIYEELGMAPKDCVDELQAKLPFSFGEEFTLSQWIRLFGKKSERLLQERISGGDIIIQAPQRYICTSGFHF
ncbi:DNA-protecting protein DprA [bacterium]|nr:DNA-protecting protein DprA [bacterium]